EALIDPIAEGLGFSNILEDVAALAKEFEANQAQDFTSGSTSALAHPPLQVKAGKWKGGLLFKPFKSAIPLGDIEVQNNSKQEILIAIEGLESSQGSLNLARGLVNFDENTLVTGKFLEKFWLRPEKIEVAQCNSDKECELRFHGRLTLGGLLGPYMSGYWYYNVAPWVPDFLQGSEDKIKASIDLEEAFQAIQALQRDNSTSNSIVQALQNSLEHFWISGQELDLSYPLQKGLELAYKGLIDVQASREDPQSPWFFYINSSDFLVKVLEDPQSSQNLSDLGISQVEIQDGPTKTNQYGTEFSPGFSFAWNSSKENLGFQANVHLSFTYQLPMGLSLPIEAHLLVHGEIQFHEEGVLINPIEMEAEGTVNLPTLKLKTIQRLLDIWGISFGFSQKVQDWSLPKKLEFHLKGEGQLDTGKKNFISPEGLTLNSILKLVKPKGQNQNLGKFSLTLKAWEKDQVQGSICLEEPDLSLLSRLLYQDLPLGILHSKICLKKDQIKKITQKNKEAVS
ncbi:MAG: hypothetical protein KDK66_09330, partial [Deltaproteobacteria bacterium]|nr:hypothetical protein [Deltaproteobacteria bacterium]